MDPRRPYRVLFLCTGNSARSILAEYLLRHRGGGRFETWSAGAQPKGEVNPVAIEVLRDFYGIDAREARSKSWEELQLERATREIGAAQAAAQPAVETAR
jgi:arsenate reductase